MPARNVICCQRRLSLRQRGRLLLLLVCVLTTALGSFLLLLPSHPLSSYYHRIQRCSPLERSSPVSRQGEEDPRDLASATSARPSLTAAQHARCNDVMASMTQGRWKRLPMTASDVRKMKDFHTHVREVEHRIPHGLQRQDGQCGNVSFADQDGEHPKWFRALCDAEGDEPCCYHNRCVSRPTDQCACPECYDMRNPLHAEYARWLPTKAGCELTEMSVEEICHLLKGATLYFIGDSFVRHIFTALLMAVRGNDVTGAFSPKIPKDLREQCSGIYMFTEKQCRLWVDTNVKVCPGHNTHLRLFGQAYNSDIRREVAQLYNKPRSLAVIGMGFHGKLQAQDTFRKVMQPLLQAGNRCRWPQLVWSSVHHWGLLKNPNLPNQSVQHVFRFNEKMKEYLRPWDVPVLDTFNMTAGVDSFDGAHYGYGVNKVKAQILLSFLKELQFKKMW